MDHPTEPGETEYLIAEAHHRVRNTLQNISAYISILLGNRDAIPKEGVNKILRYINSLSSLHEIILEALRNHGDGRQVKLDQVINEVLSINARSMALEWKQFGEIVSSPRKAATIALMINELLDYSALSAAGSTQFDLHIEPRSKRATLSVTYVPKVGCNESAFQTDPALQLVGMLAKSEIDSTLSVLKKLGIAAYIASSFRFKSDSGMP